MTETLAVILATTALNAAVTWGIVKTQLAWLRRDVDELRALRHACGRGPA